MLPVLQFWQRSETGFVFMNSILTVSQLNCYVKSVLDGDTRLRDLLLRGEISNFTNHYRSGHLYFTLKEGGSSIRCVMFAKYAGDLFFEPENGMAVIVRGAVSLYERDGSYQMYVYDMQPDGKGALQLAYEQRYRKLEQQGIFRPERKKAIPRLPERIGVVTSETGAALQDIINVLSRRYPLAQLVLAPALVQGKEAAASLANALKQLDETGHCDTIIIGRGGGSMEDLWCFNEEMLVLQVAACKTPVISAVGHETDFTLCDYAADLRAPTPSAAAELVSEDITNILALLHHCTERIDTAAEHDLLRWNHRMERILALRCFSAPKHTLENHAKILEYLAKSIHFSVNHVIIGKKEQLALQTARLKALNPLNRLASGYSITRKDGQTVHSVEQVGVGDPLEILLQDGVVHVTAEQISSIKGGPIQYARKTQL